MRPRSMPTFRRLALAATGGLAAATLIVSPSAGSPDHASSADVAAILTTSTAYGSAVKAAAKESYQTARARSESRYGRLGVIRYFDGNAPDDWGSYTSKLTDHTAIISFRIPPATVLSGSADAMLLAWFRNAPTDRITYWAYMHEPEDDIQRGEFSFAPYRAAWARVADIARSVNNPQLRATLILMCFTVNPSSGRNWTNYYSPGDIDVLGWDCYNHGEANGIYGDPATLYSRAIEVSRGAGLPWGMAEIGSKLARGDTTGTRRAAWLTDVAQYLGGQGAQFVSYFDTNGAGTDYRLLDEPSRQAWFDVVSDQTP